MIFLMMNTRYSKHIEDTKNGIKILIQKSVHFVGLHYIIRTIFIDRLPTCLAFRKAHPTLGSEFLTAYQEVLKLLRMKGHSLE